MAQRPSNQPKAKKHASVEEQRERFVYLGRRTAVEAKLTRYIHDFDVEEFRKILDWATPRIKKEVLVIDADEMAYDDQFSEPLRIVEELVKTKADWETIMAGITYPLARPLARGQGPNKQRLDEIAAQFKNSKDPKAGHKVRALVKNTLYFKAANIPFAAVNLQFNRLPEALKNKTLETIQHFVMMSLFAARDPRAILIRAAQHLVHLDDYAKHQEEYGQKIFGDDVLQRLLTNTKHVFAPLTYIAGYEKVRDALLDQYYRITDPAGFADVRKKRAEIVDVKHGKKVEELISHLLSDTFRTHGVAWERGKHFEIEFRPKSVHSTYDKIKRKGNDVADLIDLYGIRVVLRPEAVGYAYAYDQEALAAKNKDTVSTSDAVINDWKSEFDINRVPEEDRAKLMKDLGDKIIEVHGVLSGKYGRNNKKTTNIPNPVTGLMEKRSYIQERLAYFARKLPRYEDPARMKDEEKERIEKEKEYLKAKGMKIEDPYWDNGILFPWQGGLSYFKDVLFFFLKERKEGVLEAELQIMDVFRLDDYINGPRGHRDYKIGMQKHTDPIGDWWNMVAAIFKGEKIPEESKHVYVHDEEMDDVYKLTEKPTVEGFLEKKGMLTPDNGAIIANSNEHDPELVYPHNTRLFNNANVRVAKLAA